MLRIKAQQKAEQESMEDTAKAVEAGVDPAVASLHATIKSLYRYPHPYTNQIASRAALCCLSKCPLITLQYNYCS